LQLLTGAFMRDTFGGNNEARLNALIFEETNQNPAVYNVIRKELKPIYPYGITPEQKDVATHTIRTKVAAFNYDIPNSLDQVPLSVLHYPHGGQPDRSTLFSTNVSPSTSVINCGRDPGDEHHDASYHLPPARL
jgi:hypothetical protein